MSIKDICSYKKYRTSLKQACPVFWDLDYHSETLEDYGLAFREGEEEKLAMIKGEDLIRIIPSKGG